VPNHDLSPVGIFDGQGVIGGATPFTPTSSLLSWRVNTVLPPQRLFNQIGAAFFLRIHPFNEPLGQLDGDRFFFQLWRHRLSARAYALSAPTHLAIPCVSPVGFFPV
jgi:hypothetical protein